MSKSIRILETPIYLLVIAMACYEMAAGGIAIFLAIVSAARLYANIITYDSVYKKQLITNLMYLAGYDSRQNLDNSVSLQSLKENKKEQDPKVNTSSKGVNNWRNWNF